jgi:serine/threonine protein kinase
VIERTKRIEAVFHAASELPASEERERYLNEACRGNDGLRREVNALLKAALASEELFRGCDRNSGGPGGHSIEWLTERPGTVIGRYKLLEQIGEGGMGVVYMAEQEQPVRRKVALKIIKLGMDTRAVVARFEAERQALAMMDHPGIAQVYDAGATETGRPYFVMELVQGVPITQFCETKHLSIEKRLKLFISVCQAIQSAHQKGIIHRDIKPSNVLVTMHNGAPHPMVIDFGVAKAIDQKLTEKTLFTNFATMIGTPAYMSPEQAEMSKLDVDTRSDIYSLGVLLYQLLTGTTPFSEEHLRNVAYGEMQRIIVEEEPERPSTRLRRKTPIQNEIRNPQAAIDSDLDWIVMKCLEKDRNRRYETTSSFEADIKHYLANEPVIARPPNAAYRLHKFIARRRLEFSTAVIVLLSLIAAVLVSSSQAARARRSEAQATEQAHRAEKQAQFAAIESERANRETALARQQADTAEAVKQFLIDSLWGVTPNYTSPDLNAVAYEATKTLLEKSARSIEGRFTNQPLVEADIRKALYVAFNSAGRHDQAELQARRRLQIYENLPGIPRTNILDAISDIAYIRATLGHAEEALKILNGIKEESLSSAIPEYFQVNFAQIYIAAGHPVEAVPYLRSGVEYSKAERGEKSLLHKTDTMWLAQALERSGNLGEAVEVWRRNFENCSRDHGAEHPITVDQSFGLARTLVKQGKGDLASSMLKRIIAYAEKTMGTNSYRILDAQYWLGQTLEQTNKIEEAARLYRAINPGIVRRFPNESAFFLNGRIIEFFLRHRLYPDAKTTSEPMLSWLEAHLPEDSVGIENLIRAAVVVKGSFAAAELGKREFDRFSTFPMTCKTIGTLFLYVGAEDWYRKATAKAIACAPATKDWQQQLAILHIAARGPFSFSSEQKTECQRLIDLVERQLNGVSSNERQRAHRAIATLQIRLGQPAESIAHLDKALGAEITEAVRARALAIKAIALHRLDRIDEARAAFAVSEQITQKLLPEPEGERANFLDDTGRYDLLLRRELNPLLNAAAQAH